MGSRKKMKQLTSWVWTVEEARLVDNTRYKAACYKGITGTRNEIVTVVAGRR